MSLPSALNLQFDYHIWKGFYASYAGTIPFNIPGDANRATLMTVHAITPRYERPRWSIATPIVIPRSGIMNVGVVGRLSFGNFGVFLGSHTMSFLVAVRKQYDFSMFGGINVSLKHTVPPDRDEDLVSDKKDRCIDDPGPWVYRGCPDTDNDAIIDLEDHCIYDQGPQQTNGCPDRDNDGVIDVNDRCPDIAGLAVHHGCPDKDKDGVIDLADRCPDVPGIELNNGCPFENQGCCMDNDGDGISNLVDKCPEVSGSVYNEGCPIDSTNIGKVNFEQIKPIVDANHTNVQIKDTVSSGSKEVDKGKEGDPVQISSLKDIPVMNTGSKMRDLMVYFDVDQSFLQSNYVQKVNDLVNAIDYKNDNSIVFVVIGHTDADGTDNYNLLLSKRRAETVKKHLMNQGVPENQIEVYFYGEWQPLYSDDNEEHKGINRRAEVKVMKK
jgi:outer membrane protein OmpA-like peptidoglycan-associated protein